VVDCPTHSRLLQSLPDDSLATFTLLNT